MGRVDNKQEARKNPGILQVKHVIYSMCVFIQEYDQGFYWAAQRKLLHFGATLG